MDSYHSHAHPAPPSPRQHIFFKLCYADSRNPPVICICHRPGTSLVQAVRADFARRNLLGTPLWHLPADEHDYVHDLDDVEDLPDSLRDQLLGLHFEEQEIEGEDEQLAEEAQATRENEDEYEDQAVRAKEEEEEILYDSDEASEYVRTPRKTSRTLRVRETRPADESEESGSPVEPASKRGRVREIGSVEHASTWERDRPYVGLEPARARREYDAGDETVFDPRVYDHPQSFGEGTFADYGATSTASASTLIGARDQAQAAPAHLKRGATPPQLSESARKRVRFASDVVGGEEEDGVDGEDAAEKGTDATKVPLRGAKEVIEIDSSASGSSDEE